MYLVKASAVLSGHMYQLTVYGSFRRRHLSPKPISSCILYELCVTVVTCMVLDDHSRVVLGKGGNDYINASLIEATEANRRYILTQVGQVLCDTSEV